MAERSDRLRYLLDTNVLSSLVRDPRGPGRRTCGPMSRGSVLRAAPGAGFDFPAPRSSGLRTRSADLRGRPAGCVRVPRTLQEPQVPAHRLPRLSASSAPFLCRPAEDGPYSFAASAGSVSPTAGPAFPGSRVPPSDTINRDARSRKPSLASASATIRPRRSSAAGAAPVSMS